MTGPALEILKIIRDLVTGGAWYVCYGTTPDAPLERAVAKWAGAGLVMPPTAPATDPGSTPTPNPGPPTEADASQDGPIVALCPKHAAERSIYCPACEREAAERDVARLQSEVDALRAESRAPAEPDDCDQETMAPGPIRWRIGGKDCDDVEVPHV